MHTFAPPIAAIAKSMLTPAIIASIDELIRTGLNEGRKSFAYTFTEKIRHLAEDIRREYESVGWRGKTELVRVEYLGPWLVKLTLTYAT